MRDLPELYSSLAGRFGDDEGVMPPERLSLDDVRRFVRTHVARLLEKRPGLLMSILYRIDVPEAKVQDVLTHAGHSEIPDRLTDLIIERQLQKLELRRKFGSDEHT